MFHPETEDMLPRMAPKPSSSIPMGSQEANVRPQVPEVSILFGQQDGNEQHNSNMQQPQINNNTQQSYASWKKQMLPKVTYPAAAMIQTTNVQENSNKNNAVEGYNIPRSNLYPLRPMPVSTQLNAYANINGGLTNPLTYRSLENCNNNINAYQPIQHQQYQEQSSRQVLPLSNLLTKPSANSPRDILTICAGTQTEAISGSCTNVQGNQDINWSNLASKNDLDAVLQLVKDMRHEQLRIVQMLETLLFSQQVEMKPDTRDMSVQVDIKENENVPVIKGGEPQDMCQIQVPTNKFIQHLKPSTNILQTPKGKPMAQSTTYRSNSPQTQPFQEEPAASNYQKPSNVLTGLSKSSSDTSLAMNELALKYLPNDKLAELLNELTIASPLPLTQNHLPDRFKVIDNNPSTPKKGNFERSSSDISNASYKYLKKYRLLPEDHENVNDCENRNENNQLPQYYTPQRQQQQYDNVKTTPINHRQTPPTLPPGKCSPYAGRLPLSPLARASTPPTPQHIVDLENIKYQPKFL